MTVELQISTCAVRSAFRRSLAAPMRSAGDVVAKTCDAVLASAALQYCISASATRKRHVFFGQANFLTRTPAHRSRPPHLGRRTQNRVGLRHDTATLSKDFKQRPSSIESRVKNKLNKRMPHAAVGTCMYIRRSVFWCGHGPEHGDLPFGNVLECSRRGAP